jgi:hypothetical protein
MILFLSFGRASHKRQPLGASAYALKDEQTPTRRHRIGQRTKTMRAKTIGHRATSPLRQGRLHSAVHVPDANVKVLLSRANILGLRADYNSEDGA